MRTLISILFTISTVTAGADCTVCGKSDKLLTKWQLASTKEKRGAAMKKSYEFLASMVPTFEAQGKDPNGADVAAVTRVIGAIYVRDQDPRKDVLRLYRKLLNTPAFMRDFEDQLARMPQVERDKIREGIADLPNFD